MEIPFTVLELSTNSRRRHYLEMACALADIPKSFLEKDGIVVLTDYEASLLRFQVAAEVETEWRNNRSILSGGLGAEPW